MAIAVHNLEYGWEFKETGGQRVQSWLPVACVPTNVHLDLIQNDMYVFLGLSFSKSS
jgi:beta-mannosidase